MEREEETEFLVTSLNTETSVSSCPIIPWNTVCLSCLSHSEVGILLLVAKHVSIIPYLGDNIRWWRIKEAHFSALPSKYKWFLILQVISVTSGLCKLSSLIFLDKELLHVLHFNIDYKLWKVESQDFIGDFLIISPMDCVLHIWNLDILKPLR